MKTTILSLIFLAGSLSHAAEEIFSVNSTPYEIAVLGDVEGMRSRLDSFIKNSGVFYVGPQREILLKPGKAFVFQGDASDRGPDDVAILEFLISMKARYPDRVTLLIGNRDIYKLGILAALSDEAMAAGDMDYEEWLTDKGLSVAQHKNNKLTKMRYSIDGYKFRKAELEAQLGRTASDQEVYDHIVRQLQPGGVYSKYLGVAQLAFIDESTQTLFVHGSVDGKNIGYIPGQAKKITDVRKWVEALNAWARNEFVKGKMHSHGATYAGQALLDYAFDGQRSVITSRFKDENGFPELPSAEVMKDLTSQGIRRVSVGHTPIGELPVIARNDQFEILMNDASFNKTGITPKVLLNGDRLTSKVVLADGGVVEMDLRYGQNSLLGRHTTDNHIVVGVVADGSGSNYVTYHIGEKFRREYRVQSESAIKGILAKDCRSVFSNR